MSASLDERARDAGRALEHEEDPRRIVAALGGSGLLDVAVGEENRPSLGALCTVRRALGYYGSLIDTLFAMQGLGSYPVSLAGSDEQRRALLPRVRRGEAICAFAVTEPEAGSDVAAIATRARRDNSGWRLDGEKTFISNAGIADSYVLFARTGDDPRRGLSAFLVEGGAPGLASTPIELIAPHPIGRLRLDGVPGELLGAEGEGMAIALGTLDLFRASVGAAATGMGERALDEALARVRSRRQFGKALAEFQATQIAIAEMAVELEASWRLVEQATAVHAAGGKLTFAAATAKLYATEAAQRVIDRALQLHGGEGVVRGTVVERLYREIRALRIYEGTSEIQKLVIAREVLRSGR